MTEPSNGKTYCVMLCLADKLVVTPVLLVVSSSGSRAQCIGYCKTNTRCLSQRSGGYQQQAWAYPISYVTEGLGSSSPCCSKDGQPAFSSGNRRHTASKA